MKSYTIMSKASGLDLGTWDGETVEEALDAMARNAGYASYPDTCEVTGEDESALRIFEVA